MICWVISLSVQTFQLLNIIYRRGYFVYHHWGFKSIYQPLTYPWENVSTTKELKWCTNLGEGGGGGLEVLLSGKMCNYFFLTRSRVKLLLIIMKIANKISRPKYVKTSVPIYFIK